MVLPFPTGRRTVTRRNLVEATAVRSCDRARRSVGAVVLRIRDTIKILIGWTNPDVLENRSSGVRGDGRGINDLEVAADRRAVNDAMFQVAELQHRTFQTVRRSPGEIDDRIVPVGVLENGQAHSDGVTRVEVARKGVERKESAECDELMSIGIHDELTAIV